MSGQVRLIKIAAEINIGKDAIVQFLQQKGFTIENKPTSLLTEEMIDVVYDKFKKELKTAEKQREKFDKLKQTRRPVTDLKTKPAASIESFPEHHRPSVDNLMDDSIIDPLITETVVKPKSDYHDMGDLIEAMEETPSVTIEVQPEETPITEIVNIIQPEIEPKPEVVLEKKIKNSIEVSPDEKKKVKSVVKPNLVKMSQEAKKETLIESPKDDKISDEIPTYEIEEHDESSDSIDHAKKKKKRKKLAEVEVEPGAHPKIKGLTIVGRIDLKLQADRSPGIAGRLRKFGSTPIGGTPIGSTPTSEDDAAKKDKFKKKLKGAKTSKQIIETVKDKAVDKKKRRKKSIRDTITEEEVERAIRETMSGMGEASGTSMRNKVKQKKRVEREEKELRILEEQQKDDSVLKLSEFVTTSDLASLMGVNANEIILKCLGLGLMVSINQRLDKDTITLIADDYDIEVEFLDQKALQMIEEDLEDDESTLKPRAPIVTIMGHVDHGKTSLLDFIRKANVVAGEAGGITQHIGAYRVELSRNKYITFLDTPGHEAFTAMRARGALVTDIVVLVVAADDSVMPQTIEAISHAQAANVPIVVAINKMDKPDANPDRIKQQLTDYNVLVEDWGGKNQSAQISAKKGENVDILLEKILLEAELLDLKANPDRFAKGTIVESNMDKGLGPVSTVIVQKGTLNVGDYFVAGSQWGRVRAMLDERGHKVNSALPSMPIRVVGFDGLPEAGDILSVVEAEYMAKEIANERSQLRRQQEFKQMRHLTLDDISQQISVGGIKDLNLIIKSDVGGSTEALSDSLLKLSTDEVRVNILHKGVGSINESDVMLAVASGAVVIGFQVAPTAQARRLADTNNIDVRLYSIIYNCINEVKLALEGLLSPDIKEEITSQVEVRKVFKISRLGAIAGCYVLSGKITRNDKVRLLRDGLPIFTGTLESLKRNKDDAKEVESGFECGVMLNGYSTLEEGDIIESYKLTEVKRTLA